MPSRWMRIPSQPLTVAAPAAASCFKRKLTSFWKIGGNGFMKAR